ncbi:non-specific lipid-transfer protein 1-like [Lycium barbarum]|uniref:non-specific lipid-transfer protein 1-like n=1 Tax=Lycium barbarum TaxID=112863 RepID=UPI00293E7E09|nr:non-specific lipid-transfer protein 1-like [Lycium barbarum]
MKVVAVIVLVALAMVQLTMARRSGGVTCGQVDATLAPCVPFLTQGGEPGAACCSGVKTLKGMAQSIDERRTACNCVKAAANRYTNLKDDAAQALPGKCGVALDIPISRTTNCDAVASQASTFTCGQVDATLAPCVPFLTQGGDPGAACCSGVKTLKGMAQSTDERRTACNCVKAAANRYANLKDDAAQALPSKCGVALDIPISRTTNCDAIS